MNKTGLLRIVTEIKPVKHLLKVAKRISLPGFEGLPLYDVARFFFLRLKESEIKTRARAIAFSFFMALFPATIFIFTLIPYIPIESFPDELLSLIADFLPSSTYQAAKDTIEDIVKHQRGGLLSFGFIFAVYFSADGILAVMTWFNRSFHGKEQRSPWKLRIMAIGLTILLSILVFLSLSLIITTEVIYAYFSDKEIMESILQLSMLTVGKWIILLALCFTAISMLYFYGPSKHDKLKFITAGSSLATLLIVLTSLSFNYFLNNFNQYNKIYGSIGTLLIILIWIYINSFVLLVGYELNVSIRKAKKIIQLPTQ